MANWQDQVYQNYISGKMSQQGRSNYEADLIAGIVQAPEGSQGMIANINPQGMINDSGSDTAPMQQQTQQLQTEGPLPAHIAETKPVTIPDEVLKRFWDGKMSDEGMKNLIADFRSGKVVTAESEDVSFIESVKEGITGAGRRVPETEALPSWVRMPELNNLSLKAAKGLIGTMAAGPDEISSVIKKQNPDVNVAKDSKGNYVFTSGMDGERYAIKPGFRTEEDLARGAATMLLFAAGSRGGAGQRMTGAAGTQFGIEATQEATGGKFDAMEIPLAALFEGGGTLAGKGIAGIRGLSRSPKISKALKKFGVDTGPTAKTEKELMVQTAKDLDIDLLTSDVFPPKTPTQKAVQIGTERMPIIGTGGTRVAQQESRENAVRRVLNEYGATETARASDDVLKDLVKKRGSEFTKYDNQKKEVIKRLSVDGGLKKPTAETMQAAERMSPKAVREVDLYNVVKNTPDEKALTNLKGGELSAVTGANKQLSGGIPEEVTIWRKGSGKIEAGDMVSVEKSVASELDRPGKDLASRQVPSKDVYLASDSQEFFYIPKSKNTVPINKTTAAIDKEVTRLKSLENSDVEPLIDALENSRTSFTDKTLDIVEENRKQLGDKLSSDDFSKVKSQAEKVNRKIYKAVNDDMGDFIKNNGKRRDFEKWKVANKRIAGSIKDMNISALRSVIKNGKSTPEEVKKLLFSNKASDVKRLYKSLSPQGKSRARVAVWQEAMEKAVGKGGSIEDISTAKFRTALNNMEKTTGVFFKGEDKRVLDGIVKALKSSYRAEKASLSPPTGMQNYQSIAAFGLGAGTVYSPAVPATALSIGLAARAYESKPVRNLLIKIAKGQGNEQKYISQLVNILRTKHQLQRKDSAADKRKALQLINEDI